MKKILMSVIIAMVSISAFAVEWDSVIKKTFYLDDGLGVCFEVIADDVKVADGRVKILWADLSGKSQAEEDVLINSKVFDASEKIKSKFNSVSKFARLEGFVAVKDGKDLNGDKKKIMEEKFTIKEVISEVIKEVITEEKVIDPEIVG